MHLRENQFIKIFFILMIATFTISGCGGRMFTYTGDKVTQEDRMIQLYVDSQHGVWRTNELAIKYEYQMAPETLTISGSLELVGGFAIGFNYIKHITVYILFLDNHGIVIENALIYSLGNHYTDNFIPMLFERTMSIPEGTRQISFVYDGILDQNYNIWISPSRQLNLSWLGIE